MNKGAKVLVVGGGGREHALAWKLSQSPQVKQVFVAPGNAGTAREPDIYNVPHTTINALVEFVKREEVALTIVGPEAPLADGIVDVFRAHRLRILGPTKAAAMIESSKIFAKALMNRWGVPTAHHIGFVSAEAAHDAVMEFGVPVVIKADGLAAGKGVFVCNTTEEAHDAIDIVKKMGAAGETIILERCLVGEEVSFIVTVDPERNVLPLSSAQDYKRLLGNDMGPNTGGMGAFSPAPIVSLELHDRIMRTVIEPVVQGMGAEGYPFTGFLYAGLMIGPDGTINVLEFNCRLGDPETQPILMRLESDLYKLCRHAVSGTLNRFRAEWSPHPAVGVVLAAEGYPNAPRKGDPITGLENVVNGVKIFHAGTAIGDDNQIITSGGRAVCVTARGFDYAEAQRRAYDRIDGRNSQRIAFSGMYFRRDIGDKAIKPVETALE